MRVCVFPLGSLSMRVLVSLVGVCSLSVVSIFICARVRVGPHFLGLGMPFKSFRYVLP